MANPHHIPPFRLHLPPAPAPQWLFSSPHSGDYYPPAFIAASALSPADLRRSEDAHVEALLAHIPQQGAAVLAATYPRAYLDLNRGPYELDPTMFDAPLPNYVDTGSRHVRFGLGTVAKIVADGMPIYRDRLSFAAIKTRIEKIYTPFHAALRDTLNQAVQTHGHGFLLDIHSMPSHQTGQPIEEPNQKPDIVIGDCCGTSCGAALSQAVQNHFAQSGYNVARNDPYAGGFITRTYGMAAAHSHVQAIQIEISRHLYMDEQSYTPHQGFDILQKQLTDLAHYLQQNTEQFIVDTKPKAAE